MTETTKERIENARKLLDIAEKWELPTITFFAIVELADEVKKLNDMNTSLGSMINNKIVEIKELNSQLAALKEKYRWRKQSEEPAPIGQELEIYSPIQERVFSALPKGLAQSWFWRPLDLPKEDGGDNDKN